MTNEQPSEKGESSFTTDELHSVLVSLERRRVLQYFQDSAENVATLDELADQLASQDDGFDDSDQAKIVLHHIALPKLAETRVLEYDPRSNVIRYRGHSRMEAMLPRASTA